MRKSEIKKEFKEYILSGHPCIMAETVFTMDQVDLQVYSGLGTEEPVENMLHDIGKYLDQYDPNSNDFYTFIAVFPESGTMSEVEFEEALWSQLQLLHLEDPISWDEEVSADPDSPSFSFSLLGNAFYIVGLHPNSSRLSRQSPYPTLVFNLHRQFEKLREMGSYKTIRDKIRKRDRKLQGNNNAMLEDFGKASEARQYSGRQVTDSWKCPFHHK
jgi:FPC/CPF motif-containing protein YcgG